jgi:hypothetical protein
MRFKEDTRIDTLRGGALQMLKNGADFLLGYNLLGNRAEMDSPLLVMMLGFVGLWRVNPDSARHVDVDGPHRTNLLRSHAGEALELNHCPNPDRDERFDRVHECVGDRLDRLRLPDSTPAFLESLDRFQAPMHLGRDRRLFNAPTEQRVGFVC